LVPCHPKKEGRKEGRRLPSEVTAQWTNMGTNILMVDNELQFWIKWAIRYKPWNL
jgi:hypothetical protein